MKKAQKEQMAMGLRQEFSCNSSDRPIWQHSFSLIEVPYSGFRIIYARSVWFYLLAVLAMGFSLPLIITTFISVRAMLTDPFDLFLLFFSLGLNFLRIYFVKVLHNYVCDAWRQVSYDSRDQMFHVRNRVFWSVMRKNEAFHISDVEGVEIRKLEAVSWSTSSSGSEYEGACEILLKMKEGGNLILLPRLNNVQEAREIAAKITCLTGLELLTNIAALVSIEISWDDDDSDGSSWVAVRDR